MEQLWQGIEKPAMALWQLMGSTHGGFDPRWSIGDQHTPLPTKWKLLVLRAALSARAVRIVRARSTALILPFLSATVLHTATLPGVVLCHQQEATVLGVERPGIAPHAHLHVVLPLHHTVVRGGVLPPYEHVLNGFPPASPALANSVVAVAGRHRARGVAAAIRAIMTRGEVVPEQELGILLGRRVECGIVAQLAQAQRLPIVVDILFEPGLV